MTMLVIILVAAIAIWLVVSLVFGGLVLVIKIICSLWWVIIPLIIYWGFFKKKVQ